MLKPKMTCLWLLGSLGILSGCVPAGGLFCDVVSGPVLFPSDVALSIAQQARPEAVQIDAQNAYGRDHCDWPDR
jgi:hypothetical protein